MPVSIDRIDFGLVCPMANEEKTAGRFIEEVLKELSGFHFARYRLFIVLDLASTDHTLEIVKAMAREHEPVVLVWAPENMCVVDAYKAGYREAIDARCDWILEMDAGFSHQPKEIGKFVEHMAEGRDCVFGSRFAKDAYFDTGISKSRFIISKGGTVLANSTLGTKLTDMTGGFECFTRRTLQEILDKGIRSKGPFFQTEIRYHGHGYDYAEVPVTYHSPSRRISVSEIWESFVQLYMLSKDGRLK